MAIQHHHTTERSDDGWILGRWIGIREATPDGSAASYWQVPNMFGCLVEERRLPFDAVGVLDRTLSRHGADREMAILFADVSEFDDAIEVDNDGRST